MARPQANQLPIDLHYDKWSRFENFLKFAEKKEVRDRLKELDPPPISNFIDPETIESIAKARKRPPLPGKAKKEEVPGEAHRQRIQQMRELYGLFLKMEEETKDPEAPKSVPKQAPSSQEVATHPNKAAKTVLPAISKLKMQPSDLFEINTSQFASSLQAAPSFVTRPEIAQAAREQIHFYSGLKDIKEESLNENRSELQMSPAPKLKMLDLSIGKHSVVESEVDGLIKWANNLPDDIGAENLFNRTLNSNK